jgi:hypothetical protein
MKSNKSHHLARQVSAADGPSGLFPPPPLDWAAWRRHAQALKQDKKLSIADLTGRSGLDRSTVIELLGGRRGVENARIGTLWALAWALEVDDFAGFVAPLIGGGAQHSSSAASTNKS